MKFKWFQQTQLLHREYFNAKQYNPNVMAVRIIFQFQLNDSSLRFLIWNNSVSDAQW